MSLAQFLTFDIQALDLRLEPLDDREYDDETEDKYIRCIEDALARGLGVGQAESEQSMSEIPALEFA